jgi:uncharacterized SAM-binding protein YcdF (DUF218 family)
MHSMNRIISSITDFIFVSDAPLKSNVIFMPGSSSPEIPERAAALYHEGYAPLLLPSGGVSVKSGRFGGVKSKKDLYNKDYRTDCEFYTDALVKNGVPETAIIQEDKSGYTIENAMFSRKAADESGLVIGKGIIVCKSFHARRCLMLYQMAFPEATLRVCPVDVYDINRDNWHTFEYGIDRVLGELARCGNQFPGLFKAYLNG